MNRGKSYKALRCDYLLRHITSILVLTPPHFQCINFKLHAPLATTISSIRCSLIKWHLLEPAGVPSPKGLIYHRTNLSGKLTSFFAFSIWKKFVRILAAAADLEQTVCCYRTPGGDPPNPGCGSRSRGSGRDGSVTWASGDGPAALPKGTSADGGCSPPYMRPATPASAGGAPAHGSGTGRDGGRAPPGAQAEERSAEPRSRKGRGVCSSRHSFPLRYCFTQTLLLPFSFVSLFVPFSRRCLKSSVSRQRHRFFSEPSKVPSDQNRSRISFCPLLLHQKLNPGPGSHRTTVLCRSYHFPVPLSTKKLLWEQLEEHKSVSPPGKQEEEGEVFFAAPLLASL